MRYKRKCLECKAEFTGRQYSASYCGTKCRQAFNNRRATRGAMLYDAAMNGMTDTVEGLLAHWRAEDAGTRTCLSKYDVEHTTRFLHVIRVRGAGPR